MVLMAEWYRLGRCHPDTACKIRVRQPDQNNGERDKDPETTEQHQPVDRIGTRSKKLAHWLGRELKAGHRHQAACQRR